MNTLVVRWVSDLFVRRFWDTVASPHSLKLSAAPAFLRFGHRWNRRAFPRRNRRGDRRMAAANGDLQGTPKGEERPPVEPLRLPTPEEIRGQDIWNNCAVRSVASGIMGGGLGLFMGLFLGALDNPIMQDEMTGKQQFIYTAKQMGRRSISSAKAFGVMGLVFSAAECVIEKARAKHDTTNTVVAGCVTGGAISARGGPKAACAGCAGFAAFSVVIEKFLDRHT